MMPTSRLFTKAPALDRRLRASSRQRRREAVLAASSIVVNRSGLRDPRVSQALDRLAADAGDRETLRAPLRELVEELDMQAWHIEAGLPAESSSSDPLLLRYLEVFSKARAASAVLFGLEDTPEADAEAIYEAISSVDDPMEIMDIVSQRLS